MKYILGYVAIGCYAFIGLIVLWLNARERSKCNHKWEYNEHGNGLYCTKCDKKVEC